MFLWCTLQKLTVDYLRKRMLIGEKFNRNKRKLARGNPNISECKRIDDA